jgi:Ca2+-transporting ATPase
MDYQDWLASEPAEGNVMKAARDPQQNIFAGKMALHIISVGLLMGLVTWAFSIGLFTPFHIGKQLLFVLCFSQMGHVMAIRSDENLFKIGPFQINLF